MRKNDKSRAPSKLSGTEHRLFRVLGVAFCVICECGRVTRRCELLPETPRLILNFDPDPISKSTTERFHAQSLAMDANTRYIVYLPSGFTPT